MLTTFLKSDKKLRKRLRGAVEEDAGEPPKKKQRKDSGVMTRKMSQESWKPPKEEVVQQAVPVKFQRIDESKFANLEGAAKDNSYEAKKRFGQTGDTYGDWSNMRLKDKVGKGFTKEKNKMKNKNFHASGGRFNMNAINSVPM